MAPQWKQLLDHVMAVPERIYETWTSSDGWNNDTPFGREFGENGVPWCVIFDWDMYHDTGLDSCVPKVDNVVVFSNWARAHGQWSEYPSIGAWCNLGNAHTEIVVGFDADTVYTKGGNSVQAGATDSGQGNGVWSHATPRRSARVVGYFAPTFPDGICPPTADPADYRGGQPVASYHWSAPEPVGPTDGPGPAPTPTPQPSSDAFPGAGKFGPGKSNAFITRLGTMLCARGGRRFYSAGPGPEWGEADRAATQAFQKAQGWSGSDAGGIPGPTTWHLLVTGGGHDIPPAPKPAPKPVVSLSRLVKAAHTDPGAAQGHQTYADGVRVVESALKAEGLLAAQYAGDGSFGTTTVTAYAALQRRYGYRGTAADGIPGHDSLVRLAAAHGFTVVA